MAGARSTSQFIISVALAAAVLFQQKGITVKIPYFIPGFTGAMLLNTFGPAVAPLGPVLVLLAKVGLTMTLFFIGAGPSAQVVKAVGVRPCALGLLRWVVISIASLCVILHAV